MQVRSACVRDKHSRPDCSKYNAHWVMMVTSGMLANPMVLDRGTAGMLLERMAATIVLTANSLLGEYRKVRQSAPCCSSYHILSMVMYMIPKSCASETSCTWWQLVRQGQSASRCTDLVTQELITQVLHTCDGMWHDFHLPAKTCSVSNLGC